MHRRVFVAGMTAMAAAPAPVLAQAGIPSRLARAWPRTDFSRTAVPLDEILSGGVPRDGIPALTGPAFGKGAADLSLGEPVVTLALEGAAERAYPVRYLMWHEIVNDTVGGVPVAVTYCPLCNSALSFDRRVDGSVLTLGVSGLLRHSDMVMFDRETESLWQQFTGAAIVGEMLGAELAQLVSWMEPVSAFLARNPGGAVMAEPEFARSYGRNPYGGYDSAAQPFLYRGENPPHGIPPLMRVVRVGARAWPYARFSGQGDAVTIEEAGLRITWRSGMASALDTPQIASGRDVGFVKVLDAATGRPVPHEVVFAFAFHAFQPNGRWMLG